MADIISAAAGRVVTGFSNPWVATYAESSGTITYSNAQELARGVSVSLSVDSSDANNFYANNVVAETISGEFTGGTVTLTVDGLLMSAEKMIMGLPDAGTDGFTAYDDDQVQPFVGIGYITRYMSGNAVSYVPTVIAKAKFDQIEREANTQEEDVDWQTAELTAQISRSGDAKHTWLYVGNEFATEALALAALKTKLGVTA